MRFFSFTNRQEDILQKMKERKVKKTRRLFLFQKEGLWRKVKLIKNPRLALLFVLGVLSLFFFIFWELPLPTKVGTFPVSTRILDRNNQLIYEVYTDKRRSPIKLSELPSHVINATLSIEDKDFYKHSGVDTFGILRGAYNTVFKRKLQGGSTITQQLVKNALLTQERTVRRKIREVLLTLAVELVYSKDQILEFYFNQIPYGGASYGIEAAAELYFDKSAKDLTLAEASLLAGITQAPTRYSPFGARPELAKARQAQVLRRMVEDGYISEEEAEKAKAEELKFSPNKVPSGIHFALWIKDQLVEKYGEQLVESGGLRVKTTLDLTIQRFAEEAVATEVAKLKKQGVGNGAALVTYPATGEILALVGSKDYNAEDEDGKVNVTLSRRQPGSAIKPLNYALGLLTKKVTPSTLLLDIPTCFTVSGQPLYCPTNYDGQFHGATQVRFALGNSYNIPAVKMLSLNTLSEFVEFAKKMGITTFEDPKNYGLSLTLGGGEVRMVDMASSFGVFANSGIKQELLGILEVKDWQGKVLEENKIEKGDGDRVIPSEVSFLISHILLDNNARQAAFGQSSFLVVGGHSEVSVKTGTTNDRRDNWTIGFSPEVLVASWVGNNDNTPMSGAVSGVSGASPIWNRIIKFALDKIEAGEIPDLAEESSQKHGHIWPIQPDGVVGRTVCSVSGLLPPGPEGNYGCPTRFEYFLRDNLPTEVENLKKAIPIDKTNGQIARPDALPENTEIQERTVVSDPLGTQLCLDCPFPPLEASVVNPANLRKTSSLFFKNPLVFTGLY